MKKLLETDISDCPVKNDLITMLKNAEIKVEKGLVDVNDAEPETFGKNGIENPEALIRI